MAAPLTDRAQASLRPAFLEAWGALAEDPIAWRSCVVAYCLADERRNIDLVEWLERCDAPLEGAALAVLLLTVSADYGDAPPPALVDVFVRVVFDHAPSRLAWAFLGLAAYTLQSTTAQAALQAKCPCFDLALMTEVHGFVHATFRSDAVIRVP